MPQALDGLLYKRALKHSPEPRNEAWYLREMADMAYKTTGHTTEGQQHCNRLRRIASMIEALLDSEQNNHGIDKCPP